MRFRIHFLVISTLALLSSCSESIDFKLAPDRGAEYRYTVRRLTEHEGHGVMDSRVEKFVVKVTQTDEDRVEMLENVRLVKDNGAVTASFLEDDVADTWARVTRSVKGKTLTAQKGAVRDEIFHTVGRGIGMESRLPMFTFPDKEVSEGDTWMGSTEFDGLFNQNVFTVDEITPDQVVVKLVGTPTQEQTENVHGLEGNMFGHLLFERPSFMLLNADLKIEEKEYQRTKTVRIQIEAERLQ